MDIEKIRYKLERGDCWFKMPDLKGRRKEPIRTFLKIISGLKKIGGVPPTDNLRRQTLSGNTDNGLRRAKELCIMDLQGARI